MWKIAASLLLAMALLVPAWAPGSGRAAAQPVHISISCGALGVELKLCTDAVEEWKRQTGHEVTIVSTPNSSTDRLALYLQMLASGTGDIDIMQIDVVWAGILANHLIDLKPYVGDTPEEHFPALIENNTVDGRLVAMPWWADVGVLYYRKDLLEKHGFAPPQHVAGNDRNRARHSVWQNALRANEACGVSFFRARPTRASRAMRWNGSNSFGGGTIVDEAGNITVNNPRAIEALSLAQSWIGEIAPPGVLSYDEEAARGVFQTGNAVFMRNWPYAWSLAQSEDSPVRGKVGVVPLPSGGPEGKRSGTLGGWHLAISRYTKHPKEAADLVLFLTSAEQQKKRAIIGSYNPTIPALYHDPEVLAVNPFFGDLLEPLRNATARPSRVVGPHYNRLSSDFWRAAHDILAGRPVEERVAQLEEDLDRLKFRAGW